MIVVTSATWLESMAYREKPITEQSKLASFTNSRIASRTFFRRLPCTSLSSSIFSRASNKTPSPGKRDQRGLGPWEMEASWSSLWSSVRGWFSPAVLFLLLNLIVGTIALTFKTLRSRGRRGDDDDDDDDPRSISRGPPAVLKRLRSIGLYRFRSGNFPLDDAPPSSPAPQSEPPEAPDASAGG